MKEFAGVVMLLLLLAVSLSARATCSYSSQDPINSLFSISSGIAQRDAPVGSVIATASVGTGNYASCSTGEGHLYFSMDYNGAEATSIPFVYKTNVPGVGISLSNANNGGTHHYNNPPSFRTVSGAGLYGISTNHLKLVKIGDITPGVLNQGVVGHIYGDDNKTMVQIVIPEITILQVACSIVESNITVPLDDVLANNLTSVGTTAKPKVFKVNLNCDAGARINVKMTGAVDTNASTAGVLALSNAGSPGVATGVGIQILYNNAPLAINSNIVLKTSAGGQDTLLFTAQYYQTRSSPTSGSANAIATMELTYQ